MLSTLQSSDVESLADDCEVFNSQHELVIVCRGENGVCWEATRGSYIYCPGQKVLGNK